MTEPYRIRSDDTWAGARAAYLAGETAESVCVRFDLGLRAFRARAGDEGWRRADQPDPAPLDLAPEDDVQSDADDPEDLDGVDDGELRRLARSRMALAARRGLVGEALRWARFGETVARQAEADSLARERRERERARQQARDDHAAGRRSSDLLRDVTASARSIERQARAVLATDRAGTALHDLHDLHPDSRPSAADDTPDGPLSRADRRRRLKQGHKRR